ncbi:MAG: TolC family protein, partial [Deltaproteobacteria bacterium]|nr:TolC family protein [Deltaproteobacteria bacterium]
GVISAEKTFRSKLQAYSQVANLDEMLRQYSAFTQAVMTGVGDIGDKESPVMKFPFPGAMALQGEIVNQEVKIAREELETVRKTVVTDSRRIFWNLAYNRRAQEITGATLELLDQLELSARKRYEVGKESLQDVIRVQIQLEKLREELQTLKEEQKNLQTNIRKLVDLVPGSDIGFPALRDPRREHPAIEGVSDLALEKSQDLRTIRAMIGRMERMIEMAETEIYPRFTQNLSLFENKAVNQVGTIGTDAPFSNVISASSGEGLPKNSWFGLGDAYLRETREKLEALRKELKNTENVIRFKVREGWFKLDLAIREERLYTKKIRELSRLSAEVTGLRYEAGVAEMRDVIEFYMTWFEARLTSERKKSEIETARADLEEIVGASW